MLKTVVQVIDPSTNTDGPKSDDGVLEEPTTSKSNDNSGFPNDEVTKRTSNISQGSYQ